VFVPSGHAQPNAHWRRRLAEVHDKKTDLDGNLYLANLRAALDAFAAAHGVCDRGHVHIGNMPSGACAHPVGF
jgi:hypothetical protein